MKIFNRMKVQKPTAAMGNRPIRGGLSFPLHWIINLAVGEVRGNIRERKKADYIIENNKICDSRSQINHSRNTR